VAATLAPGSSFHWRLREISCWNPHLHLLTTDGGRTGDGSWRELKEWDGQRLMALFRERLLARLVERRAISKELVAKLVAWRHPGFSAHVGDRIAPEDKQRLLDTAAYLVRNPLSLKKLVYLDGQQAVLPLPDESVPGP